jgi:hypothetical protein
VAVGPGSAGVVTAGDAPLEGSAGAEGVVALAIDSAFGVFFHQLNFEVPGPPAVWHPTLAPASTVAIINPLTCIRCGPCFGRKERPRRNAARRHLFREEPAVSGVHGRNQAMSFAGNQAIPCAGDTALVIFGRPTDYPYANRKVFVHGLTGTQLRSGSRQDYRGVPNPVNRSLQTLAKPLLAVVA